VSIPFAVPIEPMLARLTRSLPIGDEWRYEPKWDGFRALVARDDDAVELWSRNRRPLGRYFPELVDAVHHDVRDGVVLDGEIVVVTEHGADFAALMGRLHPAASRAARLAREQPAHLVLFDALADGGVDLRDRTFDTRRHTLEALASKEPTRVTVTPLTRDPVTAQHWLEAPPGSGIDGVVAKHAESTYEPGRRAMVKVKAERTMDCVVAGARTFDDGGVASLLLGLYDRGVLRHVGVASSMGKSLRAQLRRDLEPFATDLATHPWARGFALEGGPMGRLKGAAGRWTPDLPLDWVPIAPVRVCEVAYDQVDGHRLRHPARFRRWRPDRDPESCTVEQLVDARAVGPR
jgi:ATP-dependent DNA ligase